MKIVSQRHNVL